MLECWQAIEPSFNQAIMKTIAVISQKGGAGKTTIALNLAVAAVRSGHQCAVIDIDPQASAKCWHDLRRDDAPVVVSAQAARLPEILQTAKQNGADLVIIDTAPHSESAESASPHSMRGWRSSKRTGVSILARILKPAHRESLRGVSSAGCRCSNGSGWPSVKTRGHGA